MQLIIEFRYFTGIYFIGISWNIELYTNQHEKF